VITSPLDMSYSQRWSFLNQNNHKMLAFVVMPNHIHAILYFPGPGYNLNKIISNAKRFLAYEMINRLEEKKLNDELDFLHGAVTKREAAKGQIHKVFEESFDAKGIYSEKFFMQKVNYIHHNPVKEKWNLLKSGGGLLGWAIRQAPT